MKSSLKLRTQYEFKPPFDSYASDDFFIVLTESTIESLVHDGIDVYNLVYEPIGISIDVYKQDYIERVSIVTLNNGVNNIFIPSKYITPKQEVSRFKYTPYGLTVNLGNLTTTDLIVFNTLKSSIVELVKHHLGVTPVVNDMPLGTEVLKTEAEHITIKTARTVIKQTTPIAQTQNAILQAEITRLQNANQVLSDLIIAKIPIG